MYWIVLYLFGVFLFLKLVVHGDWRWCRQHRNPTHATNNTKEMEEGPSVPHGVGDAVPPFQEEGKPDEDVLTSGDAQTFVSRATLTQRVMGYEETKEPLPHEVITLRGRRHRLRSCPPSLAPLQVEGLDSCSSLSSESSSLATPSSLMCETPVDVTHELSRFSIVSPSSFAQSPLFSPSAVGDLTPFPFPDECPFSHPDAPSNIVTGTDGHVKLASIVKLVERLTPSHKTDLNYQLDFLLTYSSFMDATELMRLLILRYDSCSLQDLLLSDEEKRFLEQRHVVPIRIRCINVLKMWLDQRLDDFDNTVLRDMLLSFIDNVLAHSSWKDQGCRLRERLVCRRRTSSVDVVSDAKPPPSILAMSSKWVPVSPFRFKSVEIARQLTLLDSQAFASIPIHEFLKTAWTRSDRSTRAPMLVAFIERFNSVSRWIGVEVLARAEVRERSHVITKFIKVAKECRKLCNFNAIAAILAGLQNPAVERLKQSWEDVGVRFTKAMQELVDLNASEENYKSLRTTLRLVRAQPCIPFMGLYLRDLLLIEETNPDTKLPPGGTSEEEEDGGEDRSVEPLINFDKHRMVAAILRVLRNWQNHRHVFFTVSPIQQYLEKQRLALTSVEGIDDALYGWSEEREATGGTQ